MNECHAKIIMKSLLKRKYQTLGLIVIIGIIFYLLQALTMSQLSHASRNSDMDFIMHAGDLGDGSDERNPVAISRNRIVDADSKFKIDGVDISLDRHRVRNNVIDHKNVEPAKKQSEKEGLKNVYLENNYVKEANDKGIIKDPMKSSDEKLAKKDTNLVSDRKREPAAIKGVILADMNHYNIDNNNMFQCLKAIKIRIRADQINDDFCDCPDGSDEPGTSACPNGRFYCQRQLKGKPSQFIPSSRVNDGLCDCCDGSDEWKGNLVPDFMIIKAGQPRGVLDHAPCPDSCGNVLTQQHQEDVLRAQGRQLRDAYLKEAARNLQENEKKKYGPDGVFYGLSKICFDLKADHYVYKVCPFSKVTQSSGGGNGIVLGETPTVHLDKGEHWLVMRDGDAHLCPAGRHRQAKIHLICGLQNRVVKVQESELCEYTFTMRTPAAC